jgi:hypothetical protein
MNDMEINRLCATCANPCKQNLHLKIVECPKFAKLPDEREFRQMVDDLAAVEEQARALQKRAKGLIGEALEGKEKGIPEENEGNSETQ